MHYYNRQFGFTGPLILSVALVDLIWAAFAGPEIRMVLLPVGTIFLVLTACFWHLEVEVKADDLFVRFGPLPFFRTRRSLTGASAQVGRSDVLDGWGIHCVPGRSVIWNIHGFDCVEITLADGRRIRVGTNDPQGLADAVNQAGGSRS